MLPKRTATRSQGEVPAGQRVYAIGDVHGCLEQLETLLATIAADDAEREPARTHLILLGDLVDRGPDSAGVVERVRQLAAGDGNVRCLAGNHEEVFLRALEGDLAAMKLFCRIGGRETLASYGIGGTEYRESDWDELIRLAVESVPERHIAFLSGLEDMIRIGTYTFVHAGIRPGVSLDEQVPADLRWIRREFLEYGDPHGCVVVHGHTISEAAELKPNRIGIDTGAFTGGPLTAIGLQGTSRWLLSAAPAMRSPAPAPA